MNISSIEDLLPKGYKDMILKSDDSGGTFASAAMSGSAGLLPKTKYSKYTQ